jgi:hypothetical protein
MRGAPQVGFSETIRKIKARTSLLTRFRPPTCLTLEIQVQYKRKPARCQFTTVLGVTNIRGFLHPDQHVFNATQNSLCRAVNRRRGCCVCRASNCRRRARFSRTRSSRERKTLTNQPRKCRSDIIMARIVAEKSESSFSQVIHSAGVRRFGEAQLQPRPAESGEERCVSGFTIRRRPCRNAHRWPDSGRRPPTDQGGSCGPGQGVPATVRAQRHNPAAGACCRP